MKKIKNFRELIIWQQGMKIVINIYQLVARLPTHETYGLASQIRRATISIPSNIAEGFNRLHNKEYKQFLYTALGSCAELETQLEIATELDYVDRDKNKSLLQDLTFESCMIRNLIKKLE